MKIPLAALLLTFLQTSALAEPKLQLAQLDPTATLNACLVNARDVRERVHFFQRTPGAREEFDALYAAFVQMVVRRRNEGWSNGEGGNFMTNMANAFRNPSFKSIFGTADTWQASRTALDRAILRERQRLAAAPAAEKPAIARKVQELEDLSGNSFGVCQDWAMETADTLRELKPKYFSVRSGVLDGGSPSRSHAYTLLCLGASSQPNQCMSFDPWPRGLPELATGEDAAFGPFVQDSCFKTTPPPGA